MVINCVRLSMFSPRKIQRLFSPERLALIKKPLLHVRPKCILELVLGNPARHDNLDEQESTLADAQQNLGTTRLFPH